jgi:2',3'-cyclic-nucleotide 2'-phosphodiesterase (5'-nucleotidase family)
VSSIQIFDSTEFRALDLAKTYELVLTDFNARGGDGYPNLREHLGASKEEIVDAAALKNFDRGFRQSTPNDLVKQATWSERNNAFNIYC